VLPAEACTRLVVALVGRTTAVAVAAAVGGAVAKNRRPMLIVVVEVGTDVAVAAVAAVVFCWSVANCLQKSEAFINY